MYTKLITYSRAGLKDAIVALQTTDKTKNEEMDEFKKEAKKHNDRLHYLEALRDKIVHYQSIRNGTNSGYDIIDEEGCDEGEVLERLDIYLEMNKTNILE